MFSNFLERDQKLQPELFTTGVFIGDFSRRRITRRRVTMEAKKNNVYTVAIELINRWRKRYEVLGIEAGILMWQVYTQIYIAAVASLCFSQSH